MAVLGEKSTALLQVVTSKGKPYVEEIKSLECELVSEVKNSRARVNIERIGQNQYKISYHPITKGRH